MFKQHAMLGVCRGVYALLSMHLTVELWTIWTIRNERENEECSITLDWTEDWTGGLTKGEAREEAYLHSAHRLWSL
uniref:Putative secreted protein n=1 Tax=Anopheles darlingi TaxID=43151 RepID=A0A2M4DLI7_ANODA